MKHGNMQAWLDETRRTMFKLPKPQLALELVDTATSDDPLEIHLQRRGWKLPRVRQLQQSISKKLTANIFTRQTELLNASELELQRDIQSFITKGGSNNRESKTHPDPNVNRNKAQATCGRHKEGKRNRQDRIQTGTYNRSN